MDFTTRASPQCSPVSPAGGYQPQLPDSTKLLSRILNRTLQTGTVRLGMVWDRIKINQNWLLLKLDISMLQPVRKDPSCSTTSNEYGTWCLFYGISCPGGYNSLWPLFGSRGLHRPNQQTQDSLHAIHTFKERYPWSEASSISNATMQPSFVRIQTTVEMHFPSELFVFWLCSRGQRF
jgi:hypothetical protein